MPLLATSTINQLLQTTIKLYDPEISNASTASQSLGQSSFNKSTSCSNIISHLEYSASSRQGPHFAQLLEDLVSVCITEYGFDGENTTHVINDPKIKNIEIFVVKILKPLLSELLAISSFREAKLPCQLRNSHESWATQICKSNGIKYSKFSPHDDSIFAQDVAIELCKVTGSAIDGPVEISELYPVVNKYTSIAVIICILQSVEAVICDVDWAIRKLKELSLSSQIRNKTIEGELALDVKLVLEDNMFSMSEAVVRQLAQITKLQIAPRRSKQLLPSTRFHKLHLTFQLYNFVAEMQKVALPFLLFGFLAILSAWNLLNFNGRTPVHHREGNPKFREGASSTFFSRHKDCLTTFMSVDPTNRCLTRELIQIRS
ncbi:hypothetical protein ACJRO7_010528 [Eucalyptus globulus]|uniref:FANCI solenoid 4 domain-containing protein n=1 Tax=Eucalyptus globulus TaxID=34317 RepID=A0ABD3LMA1_EUCGL